MLVPEKPTSIRRQPFLLSSSNQTTRLLYWVTNKNISTPKMKIAYGVNGKLSNLEKGVAGRMGTRLPMPCSSACVLCTCSYRIEKSSVLRSLLDAAELVRDSREKLEVDCDYFFDCLFTTKNLKLVETACHDKTEHTDQECDPNRIVRKR